MTKSLADQKAEIEQKMGMTPSIPTVHEIIEDSPLDALFSQTYTLKLPDGVDVELRRLPFSTVSFALGVITRSAHTELMASRKAFSNAIAKMAVAVKDAGGIDQFLAQSDGTSQMLTIFAPLLQTLATTVPLITAQILKDCIVGLKAEMVDRIPLESGLLIVSAVIQHTDRALIARQLNEVFLALAEVVENLTTSAEDQENLSPTAVEE
jgi:hypothetical protein